MNYVTLEHALHFSTLEESEGCCPSFFYSLFWTKKYYSHKRLMFSNYLFRINIMSCSYQPHKHSAE